MRVADPVHCIDHPCGADSASCRAASALARHALLAGDADLYER